MIKLSSLLKCFITFILLSLVLQAQAAYNGKPITPVRVGDLVGNHGLTSDEIYEYYDYYAITTAEELYGYSYIIYNTGQGNAILLNDIVVNEDLLDDEGNVKDIPGRRLHAWFPIGNNDKYPFSGEFDGRGHTISGLYFDNEASAVGLFASVCSFYDEYETSYPHIINVHLRDSYFASNGYATNVGGLAGKAADAKIEYCSVANVTLKAESQGYDGVMAGGLGAYLTGSTSVTDSYAAARLAGDLSNSRVLQFGFGSFTSSVSFSNCYYAVNDLMTGKQEEKDGLSHVSQQQLNGGYLCYQLNGGVTDGTQLWYQNLSALTKSVPTPFLNPYLFTVYQTEPCHQYTNYSWDNYRYHDYDDATEQCQYCDVYLAPSKNSDGYYMIKNANQLYWFANLVNNAEVSYDKALICNDLVINENVISSANRSSFRKWTPIGTGSGHKFSGTIDGQGHSISGLYIDASTTGNWGFVGHAASATIQNLRLTDCYIRHINSGDITGVAAAYGASTTLRNVHTQFHIESQCRRSSVSAYYGVGGMIGNASGCNFYDCSAVGYIGTSFTGTGGILGTNGTNKSYLNRCVASVKISAMQSYTNYTYIGALVGYVNNGSIGFTDCYYRTGQVTDSRGTQQGGFGYPTAGSRSNDTKGITGVDASTPLSGSVAYTFNSGITDGTQFWYQNIDNGKTTDVLPIGDPSHGTVYDTYPCASGQYSNTLVTREHEAGDDRICDNCGQLTDPQQDEEGYYLFTSPVDFQWLHANLKKYTTSGIKIRLDADLDFIGIDYYPIGSRDVPFVGIFEGQGHTISGINFTDATVSTRDNGLFGYTSGSTSYQTQISGIHLDSSCTFTSTNGSNYTGSIAAYITYTTISDCCSEAYVSPSWNSNIPFMVESCSYGSQLIRCVARYKNTETWTYYTNSASTTVYQQEETLLVSGELCYTFNNSVVDGSQLWYQNLDNGKTADNHPVMDNSHGTVMVSTPCPCYYTNGSLHAEHSLGADGICEVCLAPAAPALSDDGYYLLYTPLDLLWATSKEATAIHDIKLRLMADIDLDGMGYSPARASMYGEFDGNGHVINSLKILSIEAGPVGMFCTLGEGAYVHDLILINASVSTSSMYACEGIIAGEMKGATIENCLIAGNVLHNGTSSNTSNFKGTGVFAGHSSGGNMIRSCFISFSLVANGGSPKEALIGQQDPTDTFERCYYYQGNYYGRFDSHQATIVDREAMFMGGLCYQLNNGVTDGTQAWYQTLRTSIGSSDGDELPSLNPERGTVYKGIGCLSGYTNSEAEAMQQHDFDADGFCTHCEKPLEPEQDADGWYLLSQPRDLYWLGYSNGYAHSADHLLKVRLMADLDFSQVSWMASHPWKSISMDYVELDGNGHTISGLKQTVAADDDDTYASGLFYETYLCHIHDLSLRNCTFTSYAYTDDGGLIADPSCTTIERCLIDVNIANYYDYSNDDPDNDDYYSGLLIGYSYGENVISDCLVMGSITSSFRKTLGSVCFAPSDDDQISNCLVLSSLPGASDYVSCTADDLAFGWPCYALNQGLSDETCSWRQNLDNGKPVDATPVLDRSHGVVLAGGPCFNGFTNLPALANRNHEFGADGFCIHCSKCDTPAKDAQGYYLLSRISDFFWWSQVSMDMDDDYPGIKLRLTRDFDFSDLSYWMPLALFYSELDGQGHSISGINGSVNFGTYNGFLAISVCSYIHDLELRDCIFESDQNTIDGGLVSMCYSSHIERCIIDVTVSNTYDYAAYGGTAPSDDPFGTGLMCGVSMGSNDIERCLLLGSFSASKRKNVNDVFGATDPDADWDQVYNNYIPDEHKSDNGRCQAVSAQELASGRICFDLNGYDGQYWRQNIDNGQPADATPVFDQTHGIVYPTSPCYGYSNLGETRAHTYGADNCCTVCGNRISEPRLQDGWYIISETDHLYWFANQVNSGNNAIKGRLTNSSYYIYELATPIGSKEYPFRGSFDGGHATINPVRMAQSDSEGSYAGLFGYIEGTAGQHVQICNLKIESAELRSETVGALAAFAKYADIDWVDVTNSWVDSDHGIAGGLIGQGEALTLSNIHVHDTHIQGALMTGGILGHDAGGNCTVSHSLGSSNKTDPTIGTSAAISPDAHDIIVCYYSNYQGELYYGDVPLTPWSDSRATEANDAEFFSGYICYQLNDCQQGSYPWIQTFYGEGSCPGLQGYFFYDNSLVYCQDGSFFYNKNADYTYTMLSDAMDFTLSESRQIEKPLYLRKTSAQWGTICLPFDFYGADCNFFCLDHFEGNTIYFSPALSSRIDAWEPVIYRCEGNMIVKFEGATESVNGKWMTTVQPVPDEIFAQLSNGAAMQGTAQTLMVDPAAPEYVGHDLYYLSGNTLWHGVIPFKVRPFRVWFDLLGITSGAPARFNLEETETGETDLRIVIQEDGSQTDITRDLLGRSAGKQDKGMLIEGGKVIFRK